MDLTTAAVTITQLLGMYRQEIGARKDHTHRQFIEWLEYHRHEEIKELVTHTFHLQSQVDDLLRRDQTEIIAKLDQVNQIVVDILARVEVLAPIATKIVSDFGLSDAAIGMLKLAAKSQSGELFAPGEGQLIIDDCLYQSADPKFLHDDLDSLVAHGFFSISYSQHGKPFYRLTRRGAQFFDMLSAEPDC
jgi:hypothetical protein